MASVRSTISLVGIGIGSVALLIAIIHFWIGPFDAKPALEQTVADKALAIKNATVAALKGEKVAVTPQARSYDIDQIISTSIAVLSGLVIILGVIGLATDESMRAANGAILLGGATIAFQLVTIAAVGIG